MLQIKLGYHVLSHTMYQYMPAVPILGPNFSACQNLGYPFGFKHIKTQNSALYIIQFNSIRFIEPVRPASGGGRC